MKIIFTLFAGLYLINSHAQVGKLSLNITLTKSDTPNNYYVRTWLMKEDLVANDVLISATGIYDLGSYNPGSYKLELYDYNSRRMHMDTVLIIKDSIAKIQVSYPGPCKFLYPDNYKPICPLGDTNATINITYGFPNKKAIKKANKGLVHLGGCILTDCDPKYYCKNHKLEF